MIPEPRMEPDPLVQLSPHFTLAQLTYSATAEKRGINNIPGAAALTNLQRLAVGLEEVRSLLGFDIEINSGFRCPELNAAVGGAPNSQHVQGLAADFICPKFGNPLKVVLALARSNIEFDQCILEFSDWVHLSLSATPRGRILTIYSGTQGYLDGLWDEKGNRWA